MDHTMKAKPNHPLEESAPVITKRATAVAAAPERGLANDNLLASVDGDPLFMSMARREIAATRLW